ncbi:MAG: hypothetical protein HRT73_07885, partial [Flavobacteriales bacterium]|nr:hypothetical protein [Flavobacteriales bacterium]
TQEHYYFKNLGEKTIYNSFYYDQYGGDQPAHVQLSRSSSPTLSGGFSFNFLPTVESYIKAKAEISVKDTDDNYSQLPVPSNFDVASNKNKREPRNHLFKERFAGDASSSFFEADIISKGPYNDLNPLNQTFNRNVKPSNHISEITITEDNGGKHIYGIPVYNHFIEQSSKNAGTGSFADSDGLTSVINGNTGYDDYASTIVLPAYATDYLLTATVSADYIDRTGDGPSEDDYGHYTKFNYSKIHSDYRWRVPYEKNKGMFNEAHKAYNDDNTVSYSQGTKDVWYSHSIESKNYIAEFYLSDREDGVEALDRNGGLGSKLLKKLDRIELYAKENTINAIPIKTVHFKYDYTLCPGIPNNTGNTDSETGGNEGGKLTLRKVYFTYGNSEKGEKSVYEFKYADHNHNGVENEGGIDVNYPYSYSASNIWGNYVTPVSNPDVQNKYTQQADRILADKHSAAWRLTSIKTPEGSEMEVYYEADDYAFVQNKRAMQMFNIVGVSSSIQTSGSVPSSSLLYTSTTNINNVLYFKLQESGITQSELEKDYFDGIDYLYFKSLVKLVPNKNEHEYVSGYAKINSVGLMNNGTHGWIELDRTFFNGNGNSFDVGHPISKAAWQELRKGVPRIFQKYTNKLTDLLNLTMIAGSSIMDDIGNKMLYSSKNLANEMDLTKSWVRLLNPNKKKIGGGARVSKIIQKDAWGNMGGTTEEYGNIYIYSSIENGKEISNGVSAYEPYGNEENPLRIPEFYKTVNRNFPDDYSYQEKPFGESHFPSAQVGYSAVTVKNLERANVTEHATGYVVNKFYTAKDFPTLVDRTKKQVIDVVSRPISPLQFSLGIPSIDHLAMSQGFTIHKNDMHGKRKGTESYNECNSLINKATIYYKSIPIDANSYKLDNTTTIINSDGTISEAIIGKDMDVFNTYRETYDNALNIGFNKTKRYGIFNWGSGSSSMSITKSSKKLYTSVLTKVINQYGLIDRVETEELGARQVKSNIAYDGETGNLLLSSTQNEYKDDVYNFTYPAHWFYDNLGQKYKNIGITLGGLTSTGGVIQLSALETSYFTEGDKLLINGATEAWITVVDNTNNQIRCINEFGYAISSGTVSLIIVESGRKNLQTLPIGNITTLVNPIVGNQLQFSNVLNSSAIEFSDDWATVCVPETCDEEHPYDIIVPGDVVNPFKEGIKGKWRTYLSYSYNQDRVDVSTSSNSNLRLDGVYTSFKPFWDFNSSGKLVPIYDLTYPGGTTSYEKWKVNTEITRYGKDGNLLETKDVINRYATTLYGYNNTFKNIPIAIASNAAQKQIGFDGFESYEYQDNKVLENAPGHFDFSYQGISSLSEEEAHTGLKSLKIGTKSSIQMSKIIRPDCELEDLFPFNSSAPEYVLQNCDCEQQFSPSVGKYIVSAWVKQEGVFSGGSTTLADIRVSQIDVN